MSGPERRQHQRFPLLLRVGFAGGEVEWTENISAGGLFVRSTRQLERGKPIEVEVSFPGVLQPLTIAGAVAWSRPGSAWQPAGFGIQAEGGREQLESLARAAEAKTSASGKFPVLAVKLAVATARAPIEVTPAANPEGALAALDEPPRLVLTSLFAPATECLRMIKELRGRVKAPIVALSNGSADEDQRALQAGAVAVISKPARLETVYDTVATLLRL
jgi:CheY-like chemotaxis protein